MGHVKDPAELCHFMCVSKIVDVLSPEQNDTSSSIDAVLCGVCVCV